jgi:hypothetical protein
MSRFTQFFGATPIGAAMLHPDIAPTITLADGSVWLRAGVFASPASYPEAALLPHLKAISVSQIAYTFGNTGSSAASDGAGTIIMIAGASAANINRSTDGGVTWASVTVSASLGGLNAHHVYYLNGKFWAIANDGTAVYVAESTTGATGTWTQRTVITGLATITASTALLDWTGTNFVVAIQSTSASNSIYTSPTGVTWTGRTTPFAFNGFIGLAASATGGTVVATRTSSYCVSTDHGATWGAGLVLPASAGFKGVFSVGNRFFVGLTNGIASTTTPGTESSWARVGMPADRLVPTTYAAANAPLGFLSADRSAFYTAIGGVAGMLRFNASGQVEWRATDRNNFSSSSAALVAEPGRVVFLNSSTASSRASADFDNTNAIAAGYESGASATVPQATYVRVA